jgi:hypothetical protein
VSAASRLQSLFSIEYVRCGFFVMVCSLVLSTTPEFWFNPDASYYYSVGLRVARGEFSASVDGMYSPLLSWLFVPFIWLRVDPVISYRIINSVCLAIYSAGAIRLSRLLGIREWGVACLLLLVIGHGWFYASFLITSDLLVSAIYMVFICRLISSRYAPQRRNEFIVIGFMLAFIYYAKVIQYFIGVLVLVVWFVLRTLREALPLKNSVSVVGGAVIVSLIFVCPWIVVLSLKYGTFVLSGQDFIMVGGMTFDEYHPDVIPRRVRPGTDVVQLSESEVESVQYGFTAKALSALMLLPVKIQQGYQSIWRELSLKGFFSARASLLYLFTTLAGLVAALLSLRTERLILVVCIVVQCIVYLCLWGGRFRYYLPVIPFCHLFFVSLCQGLTDFARIQASSALSKSFIHCTALGTSLFILGSVGVMSRELMASVVERIDTALVKEALQEPELLAADGPIIGRQDDPHVGYLGATLGREVWTLLNPDRLDHIPDLKERLAQWRIEQILWVGPPARAIEDLGYRRLGPIKGSTMRLFIYNVKGAG